VRIFDESGGNHWFGSYSGIIHFGTAITRTTRSGRPAQLRLIELREKARQALGERFSLKDFHNAVRTTGTLPIDMLEREVDTYIQSAARR
jgi:hypothetical protein